MLNVKCPIWFKLLLISLLLVNPLALNLFSGPVHAADFAVDRIITYSINELHHTTVEEKITIENLTTEKYPKNFKSQISNLQPNNIYAQNQSGESLPATFKTNWQSDNKITTIEISFITPQVGKNTQTQFQLYYDLPESTTPRGQISELKLPRFLPNELERNTQIFLRTAPQLGPLAFSSPSTNKIQSTNQAWDTYTINSEKLENTSFRAIFGHNQIYRFELKYYLNPSNNVNDSKNNYITLPPDTDYQRVAITNIDPPPTQVNTDPDHNWLAHYPKKQTQTITVQGTAMVFSDPWKTNQLPQPDKWQQSQPYWQLHKSYPHLKDPQSIYQFVTQNLQYNYSKLSQNPERLGANQALLQPNQAICTEFTDLFIALARDNNIPARQAIGFAFSDSPQSKPLSLVADILHAWPEYWNSEQRVWNPVDPTWGVTSNTDYFHNWDLNHLTFVYNGIHSTHPLPAGFYKHPQNPQPDIKVQISDTFPDQAPQLQAEIQFQFPWWPFNWIPAHVQIINHGPTSATNINVVFPPGQLPVTYSTSPAIQIIPPYGHQVIPIQIKPAFFTQSPSLKLNIQNQNHSLSVPWIIYIWQWMLTLIIIILTIITALTFFKIKKQLKN